MKIEMEEIEDIINELDRRIKWYLYETEWNEREDLSQDLKIKIIEKLLQWNEKPPDLFDLASEID